MTLSDGLETLLIKVHVQITDIVDLIMNTQNNSSITGVLGIEDPFFCYFKSSLDLMEGHTGRKTEGKDLIS